MAKKEATTQTTVKRSARKTASDAGPLTIDPQTRMCVIYGTEEMLKQHRLDELRAALRQQHGEFDSLFFDGTTACLADVLDEVRTYSLLQPFKLVLVDDADEFIAREGHREALQRYAEAPVEQAVLVLRASTWRAGNIDKIVEKIGFIVRCDPMTPPQAIQWATARAKTGHGFDLAPQATALLIDRMGTDLLRLDNELAKLALQATPNSPVGIESVRELVGQSSDEKAWAIQEAVLESLKPGTQTRTAIPRGKAVIEKLHKLIDLAGNDEVPVQYAITDLMRKITLAAILRTKGMEDFKIGKTLGLWGPGMNAILDIARKIEPIRARRWFDRAMELDLRSRTSLGESMRNLECFCAQLADELK